MAASFIVTAGGAGGLKAAEIVDRARAPAGLARLQADYRSGFVISDVKLLKQLVPRDPHFEFFAAGKFEHHLESISGRALHRDFHLPGDDCMFAIGGDYEIIVELGQRHLVLII